MTLLKLPPSAREAPIIEAVATYTSRAAEKLGAQQSLCKRLRVSIRTGMFNPDEAKYANGVLVELPYPTDDTRLLTKAAQEGVERVMFQTLEVTLGPVSSHFVSSDSTRETLMLMKSKRPAM
ncbi:DNA polymerase V subunit UmuC [compost metagenome]